MKKTYIAPAINVVKVQTTIMSGSNPTVSNDESYDGDLSNVQYRHNSIQWIDDEDDEI